MWAWLFSAFTACISTATSAVSVFSNPDIHRDRQPLTAEDQRYSPQRFAENTNSKLQLVPVEANGIVGPDLMFAGEYFFHFHVHLSGKGLRPFFHAEGFFMLSSSGRNVCGLKSFLYFVAVRTGFFIPGTCAE